MKISDFLVEKEEELVLDPLKFKKNALRPIMSEETVHLHYDVLTKAYFKKYAETGEPYQKAGAFLHNIWWQQLTPEKTATSPKGQILEFVQKSFKDLNGLKTQMSEALSSIKGSGWAYLSTKGDIKTIHDHQIRNDILLLIDNFEHAWLLDHPDGDKKRYYSDIWKIIDWDFIQSKLVK